MVDSDFKELQGSEQRFPGKAQIMLCGMKLKEQELFRKIVKKCHIEMDLVHLTEEHEDLTLEAINNLPADTGKGEESDLDRAVIIAGITEKEFQRLLARVKKSTFKRPLWATLTETSKKWELHKLLAELQKERVMMG